MLFNGTPGNDKINGLGENDEIYGYGGNDTLKGGNGNDNLDGGEGKDKLYGEGGNDYLYGGIDYVKDELYGGDGNDSLYGGYGKDVLTGGTGADKFLFDSPEEGVDTIKDFRRGELDLIEVATGNGFDGGLNLGVLPANQFVLGSSAKDADDRFIYDSSKGNLFFDVDGNGSAEQILFAKLSNSPSLMSSDINIVNSV
jgi:Ca2+-binding RTX toxin-like protein